MAKAYFDDMYQKYPTLEEVEANKENLVKLGKWVSNLRSPETASETEVQNLIRKYWQISCSTRVVTKDEKEG